MLQKIILIIIVLISTNSQVLFPLGPCLENCRQCNVKNPTKCTGDASSMCAAGYVPNFQNQSCVLNKMYTNEINSLTSDKVNEDLSPWSDTTITKCSLTTPTNEIKQINVLGLYSKRFNLKRTYPILPQFKYMIYSFNFLHDSWLPLNDFLLVFLTIGGKNFKTFEISYDTRQNINAEANPIICNKKNIISDTYQLLLEIPANATNNSQILMQFSGNLTSTAIWGITNTKMIYGCSMFSNFDKTTGQCGSCQKEGFYRYFVDEIPQGCKHCQSDCLTCNSSLGCLSCKVGYVLKDKRCYPSQSNWNNFTNFLLRQGQKKNCSSTQFNRGNKTVGIQMQLIKSATQFNQIAISFIMLYTPGKWSSSKVNIFIKNTKNTQPIASVSQKNLTSTAIQSCHSLSTSYYSEQAINTNISNFYSKNSTASLIFNLSTTEENLQFGIRNLVINFRQCGGPKCLYCTSSNTEVCQVCIGLFDPKSNCKFCPSGFGGSQCRKCDLFCKTCSSENQQTCLICQSNFTLTNGKCFPNGQYTDLSNETYLKISNQDPIKFITCQEKPAFPSENETIEMNAEFPAHSGLVFGFRIYRLDEWAGSINITIDGQLYKNITITQQTQSQGSNLCSQSKYLQKDMVYEFIYANNSHNKTNLSINLKSSNKIAISSINLFLSRCQNCGKTTTNQTEKPLDQFPLPSESQLEQIQIHPTLISTASLINGFQAAMNLKYNTKIPLSAYINDKKHKIKSYSLENSVHKIFIEVQQSFTDAILQVYGFGQNATIIGQTNATQQIKTDRNLQISTIQPKGVLLRRVDLPRFDTLALQQSYPIQSLQGFFSFFAWIIVILVFISMFFSLAVTFEDLMLTLQTIFLLTYIYSNYLPYSLRNTLGGLRRVENLNYLSDDHFNGISSAWLGNVVQQTPLYLTQYKVDLNFTRAFIPIILMNAILLVWFLIMVPIHWQVNKARQSKQSHNKLTLFIQSIGGRPINFLDQIFRIQFPCTIWLALIQFINFSYPDDADRSSGINITICILSLLISIIWIIFVIVYTKKQQKNYSLIFYVEVYEDVFYRKFSLMQYPNIHVYASNLLKYVQFVLYALCGAYMTDQPAFWLSAILLFNIIIMPYYIIAPIFTDKIYLAFKIIEHVLFCVVAILMIVIYGISRSSDTYSYYSMGYVVVAFAFLLIANGLIRFAYLIFRKISDIFNPNQQQQEFVKPVQTQRVV